MRSELQNRIKESYTIIPNKLIEDNSLSAAARCLYLVLASKSNQWKFYNNMLAKEMNYSIDSLRKYFGELIETGWIEKVEQTREKGRFAPNQYILNATKITVPEKTRYGKKPTRKISYTNKEEERDNKNNIRKERKESDRETRHNFSNKEEKFILEENPNKKADVPNQHPKSKSGVKLHVTKEFRNDSAEIRLSKLLYNLIKEKDLKAKQPDWQTWAMNINRLINFDSRTPYEIEKVIRWCQASNFWYANILSTAKLREKFQQLFLLTQQKKDRRQNGTDRRYHENDPKKYDSIVTVIDNEEDPDDSSDEEGYDILNDL